MGDLSRRLDRIEQRLGAAEPPRLTIEDYREDWRRLNLICGDDPTEEPPDWTLAQWQEDDRRAWEELDRIFEEMGTADAEPPPPA